MSAKIVRGSEGVKNINMYDSNYRYNLDIKFTFRHALHVRKPQLNAYLQLSAYRPILLSVY